MPTTTTAYIIFTTTTLVYSLFHSFIPRSRLDKSYQPQTLCDQGRSQE